MVAAGFRFKVTRDFDAKAFEALRRRVQGNQQVVRVGLGPGTRAPDGTTPLAMIGAVHEFGSPEQGIPERPWLQPAITENLPMYKRLNQVNLTKVISGAMTYEQALGQLGEMAKGNAQQKIRNGPFKELSERTIKRKGSSAPLIDTGNMVQSITYTVGDRGDD